MSKDINVFFICREKNFLSLNGLSCAECPLFSEKRFHFNYCNYMLAIAKLLNIVNNDLYDDHFDSCNYVIEDYNKNKGKKNE